MEKKKNIQSKTLLLLVTLIIGIVVVLFFYLDRNQEVAPEADGIVQVHETEEVAGEIDDASGLIVDEGMNLVIAHCTGCHSAKLVTQNRFDKEGWVRVIRWMQDTQNLWDLGESEETVVAYLAKNYSPKGMGRRAPLTGIEWYELER